jgi:hypothetical protein
MTGNLYSFNNITEDYFAQFPVILKFEDISLDCCNKTAVKSATSSKSGGMQDSEPLKAVRIGAV